MDARVEFVLVGGFASVAHGASLVTRDVDVCMRFSPENLARLNQALATLHPVHRMTPQRLPFDLSADAGRGLKNLYLETDLGVLDCLGEVLGVGDFDRVNAHGVDIDIPGGKCRVLDISALIQAKQAMGRPHDLLTVTQLQAIRERKRG
ncbi:MAG: nucleotidyltransferase [Verrucomicrobiota bacterium]